MQKRAPVGGIIGKNGEYYTGGEFLPSTEIPSRHKETKKATRRQEIAPYVWEVPEGDYVSLYKQFAGTTAIFDRATGKYKPYLPFILGNPEWYTVEGVQQQIDWYESGVRWLDNQTREPIMPE